jgi:hypothetical protein
MHPDRAGFSARLGHMKSSPARRTVPLARPDIGPRELELVTQVLTSDVLAMGAFTERF